MKAVVFHEFGGEITIADIESPVPPPGGAVIRVAATGLCRSDWHGWRGHDPDITKLPHVPGHEFAGTVVDVGSQVSRSLIGQRVTMPFVAGCGTCPECHRGNQHICNQQYQPGFSGWGSFAEFVAVRYAENNLVPLPNEITSVAAASLGCRFGTAFRAVRKQGMVKPGDWIAIHGCGGVGLSAVMIAFALQARVIAVDVRREPLMLAQKLGAEIVLNAAECPDVPAAIHDLTHGGVAVSIDALGDAGTLKNSVLSLRKQGRHVQVGLLTREDVIPPEVLQRLIAWELEIAGSHGIQARAYPEIFELISRGKLNPTALVERTLPLENAPRELAALNDYRGCGVTLFTP